MSQNTCLKEWFKNAYLVSWIGKIRGNFAPILSIPRYIIIRSAGDGGTGTVG